MSIRLCRKFGLFVFPGQKHVLRFRRKKIFIPNSYFSFSQRLATTFSLTGAKHVSSSLETGFILMHAIMFSINQFGLKKFYNRKLDKIFIPWI